MDITTSYLGMTLSSPLVASASPLSEDVSNIKRMEDSGVAAVVLHSLFEEQLRLEQIAMDHYTTYAEGISPEASSFFPQLTEYRLGPEEYLEHIRKAKEAVKIPIIASLNGSSKGGWTNYAKKMQEAGADAIELNIYYIPTRFDLSGVDVEQTYIDIVKSVKSAVSIPVAVKLSPFFSNMANMARKLDDAGANALVLFNRFYQPDINLAKLEVEPNLLLSHPSAMRLPLRWIAILKGRLVADLAATSGIESAQDVIKMLLAGANATMFCSAIYKHGIAHFATVKAELAKWLEENEYSSVKQMQGSMSQLRSSNPEAFERAQYMKALAHYKAAIR